MTFEEMKLKLEGVLSHKRFVHSVNVMDTAVRLASVYGEDRERAAVAGLLHDCARDIKGEEVFRLCESFGIEVDEVARFQPELLHGPLGSRIAGAEYGITDKEILEAISCHTTGRSGMGMLDKIIFLADYIEPGRRFPGVEEVRETAANDIDRAMVMALDRTIKYVITKGGLLHPDTINARNSILVLGIERRKAGGNPA